MIDISDVPSRIYDIYKSSTNEERMYLKQILEEIAYTGESQTYRDIWLSDYKEIPVSIDTFIESEHYLGRVTRNGDAVYPYWRRVLSDIFSAGNKYQEIMLTGATRIGKTSTAITGLAYMLYRLMCLKDPQAYFGKKDVSKFSILFFNVTKDLAKGVAYREFNDTLKASPWFQAHGQFSKSEKNFYYIPEGGKIDIDYGSEGTHGLGKQVFCVVGNTLVLTEDGLKPIKELVGTHVRTGQYTSQDVVYSESNVKLTKYVTDTIRIELEDGTVIEGTPDHKVLLSDGTYKQLKDIQDSDDILTFNIAEVDHMDLENKENKFTVYVHTSPTGKRYVGITSKSLSERWGKDGKGYQSNRYFWQAINKYGWDSFEHEIVVENVSLREACELECKLIEQYNCMNPEFGYNHTSGGEHNYPSRQVKAQLRQKTSERWEDPEFRNKVVQALKGHSVSDETRRKISAAKKGVKRNSPSPLKGRKLSEDRIAKLRGREPWNKGLTKDNCESIAIMSDKLKGRVKPQSEVDNIRNSRLSQYASGYCPIWITDGQIETTIDESTQDIPEGFNRGRLNEKNVYMFKGEASIKVSSDDVNKYIELGWSRGRPAHTANKIKKSRQKFCWSYKGIVFDSAQELAQYLNTHGYPNIVSSTITALYNKGFHTSSTYYSLDGLIHREDI